MNAKLRRLRIVVIVPILLAGAGCGAVRGLACRICHRNDRPDCAPCAANVSYSPSAEIIDVGPATVVEAAPIQMIPGTIVTPAPVAPVVPAPAVQTHKPVPDEPDTELTPMPPAAPKLTPPPPVTSAKPGALSLKVTGSKAVAAVGDEVTFDVRLENTGGSPIDEARLTARFSGNLRPKRVTPDGAAEISGDRVNFRLIRPLTPMAITYTIHADVIADGEVGRVAVEVQSPILGSSPLREEVTTRVAP